MPGKSPEPYKAKMIISITCALVTASVLSLLFNSTRSVGILCVSALSYLYPYVVLPLVIIGLAIYLLNKR